MIVRSREWWEVRRLDDAPERRRGGGPLVRALLERGGGRSGTPSTGSSRKGRPPTPGRGRSASSTRSASTTRRLPTSGGSCSRSTGSTGSPSITSRRPPAPVARGSLQQARLSVQDGLWVRVVDVPAALAGRTYSSAGPVTVEVVTTRTSARTSDAGRSRAARCGVAQPARRACGDRRSGLRRSSAGSPSPSSSAPGASKRARAAGWTVRTPCSACRPPRGARRTSDDRRHGGERKGRRPRRGRARAARHPVPRRHAECRAPAGASRRRDRARRLRRARHARGCARAGRQGVHDLDARAAGPAGRAPSRLRRRRRPAEGRPDRLPLVRRSRNGSDVSPRTLPRRDRGDAGGIGGAVHRGAQRDVRRRDRDLVRCGGPDHRPGR